MKINLQFSATIEARTSILKCSLSISQTGNRVAAADVAVEANPGDTVYFNCSANKLHDTIWNRNAPGQKLIFNGWSVQQQFASRFNVRFIEAGISELTIVNVQHNDSAEYVCVNANTGQQLTVQLMVSGE